jgi:hypothetical protein
MYSKQCDLKWGLASGRDLNGESKTYLSVVGVFYFSIVLHNSLPLETQR